MNTSKIKKEIQASFLETFNKKIVLKAIAFPEKGLEANKLLFNIADGDIVHTGTYSLTTEEVIFNQSYSNDVYSIIASRNNGERLHIDDCINENLQFIKSDIITSKELNAMMSTHDLRSSIDFIDNNRIKIAKILYHIYKNSLFDVMGYSNIYEYGSDLFGLSRGSINNYINIIARFSNASNIECLNTYVQIDILENYNSYSFTQLNMLKSLSDEEIQALEFTPEMSTREIGARIKAYSDSKKAITDKKDASKITSKGNSSNDDNGGDDDNCGDDDNSGDDDYTPRKASTAPNLTLTITGYEMLLKNEQLLRKVLKNGEKFRIEFYREKGE